MLGYAAEALIGQTAWSLAHPEDIPALEARFRERLQGDETAPVSEVRMRHSDDSWRVIQMRSRLYPGGRYGEPALLITMRDITDNKRIEEDLRRTQEELLHVQKLEAVGRLAGGVAHDFNNLLTAISGHADLLLEQLNESDEARAEVDEIKHGVQRAAALTRQLLAFSRKQVMQPTVLDLHAVITEMRRMLGRLIGENIELITNSDAAGATIRADRGQIEQVLMNLVVNARDAMPRGGRVSISTSEVEVTVAEPHPSGATPGSYVRVVVADTGTGMQKEVLDHIFEPFFTTKEVGKGTGLGLATVYGIVKQSGGFIHVLSDPGKGTSIELLLPRVQQPLGRTALPIRPASNEKMSGTILIVEDEKTVRDVACRVLMRAGYDVLAAGDGVEALEVGRKRLDDVNLVLTDVIMPRLNGPDLVSQLRALRPGIRVLFTSGYTDDAVFPQGIVTPDVGFLEKPFTPASLLDAVRKAIGGDAR
jgi:two-component system, cell cycle sensor histidine kinase and response regulator CckA